METCLKSHLYPHKVGIYVLNQYSEFFSKPLLEMGRKPTPTLGPGVTSIDMKVRGKDNRLRRDASFKKASS